MTPKNKTGQIQCHKNALQDIHITIALGSRVQTPKKKMTISVR